MRRKRDTVRRTANERSQYAIAEKQPRVYGEALAEIDRLPDRASFAGLVGNELIQVPARRVVWMGRRRNRRRAGQREARRGKVYVADLLGLAVAIDRDAIRHDRRIEAVGQLDVECVGFCLPGAEEGDGAVRNLVFQVDRPIGAAVR